MGDHAGQWRKWKQTWNSYEIVSRLQSQPEPFRLATFITCIGPDALEVYNALQFGKDQSRIKMDDVLTAMENHFVNPTYERYKFNRREQKVGETFHVYLTALRAMVRTCNYGDMTDDLLKDRLVCGIRDDGVRKTLLQKRQLTLAVCIDACRAAEVATTQLKAMAEAEEMPDINFVRPKKQEQGKRQVDCHYCGKA